MKFFLALFTCTILSCVANAQYERISYKEMLVRKIKVKGRDYINKSLLTEFLKTFDPNYNNYYNDEFEFNKKISGAQVEIEKQAEIINENKVFYTDMEAEFGEYDFATKQFAFSPFQLEKEDNDKSIYNYLNIEGNSNADLKEMNCSVFLRNLNFVKGISMEENTAGEFLKSRKYKNDFGNEKVNRNVFIRVYFVVSNEMIRIKKGDGPFFEDNEYLKGVPLRIEVWGDKCRVNNLITTYYPDKNNLSPQFVTISDLLRHMIPGSNNYSGHNVSDNYKNLMIWSQYNDNCEMEKFELHIKLQKTTNEQNIILLRLYTNYNYNIRPGFTFTFYNRETNIEYPLVIYEAGVENGIAILKIKVTSQTLNQIINSNCYSFKMQLNGNPQYSIPGGGVSVTSTEVKRSIDMADFNLGNTAKETLFNTLKQ